MKHITIVFDIDGILADYYYSITSLFKRLHGTPSVPVRNTEAMEWGFEWLGINKKEVEEAYDVIKNSDSFYIDMKETSEGIVNEVSSLKKDNVNIFFATTRLGTHDSTPENLSSRWLIKHGFENPFVISTDRKGEFCNLIKADYFIDDKPSNVEDVCRRSPETKCYTMNYQYASDKLPMLRAMGATVIESTHDFIVEMKHVTNNKN